MGGDYQKADLSHQIIRMSVCTKWEMRGEHKSYSHRLLVHIRFNTQILYPKRTTSNKYYCKCLSEKAQVYFLIDCLEEMKGYNTTSQGG